MITELKLIIGEIEAGFAALFALEARAASPALKEAFFVTSQVQGKCSRLISLNCALSLECSRFFPGCIVPIPLG